MLRAPHGRVITGTLASVDRLVVAGKECPGESCEVIRIISRINLDSQEVARRVRETHCMGTTSNRTDGWAGSFPVNSEERLTCKKRS